MPTGRSGATPAAEAQPLPTLRYRMGQLTKQFGKINVTLPIPHLLNLQAADRSRRCCRSEVSSVFPIFLKAGCKPRLFYCLPTGGRYPAGSLLCLFDAACFFSLTLRLFPYKKDGVSFFRRCPGGTGMVDTAQAAHGSRPSLAPSPFRGAPGLRKKCLQKPCFCGMSLRSKTVVGEVSGFSGR